MRAILASLGLLAALPAIAQPVPPPPQLPCGLSTTACQKLAPRTNLFSWGPFGGLFSNALSPSLWQLGVGRTSAGIVELEDDFDAVRLRFGSGGSNSWTLTQAGVASSSSYGPTPSTQGGEYPYEVDQTSILAYLPVTFNGGGSCAVAPWPGGTANYADPGSKGNFSLTLRASVSTTGQPVITFATTVSSTMTGQVSPVAGMYASDGLGHVTAGSKVTSVSSTSVTLDTNLAAGVTASQQIYFTWKQPTLTFLVPASTNAPAIQEVCSDYIPLSSFPRTDGGFSVGMTASGTNVSGTITAVGPASVTLSTPISGTVAANAAITFSTTKTTTGALTGAYIVPVASTSSLQVGQTVTGTGIPASDWVSQVGQGYVRLNAPATGAVSGTLTFSNVARTKASTASGSVLPFMSTSAKRLLLFRAAATSGTFVSGLATPDQQSNLQEQALGLAFWKFFAGGTADDNINLVTTSNTLSVNQNTPVSGVDYVGRHRGVQIATAGDSMTNGATSAGNIANFIRRSAALLSTPATPVAFRSFAFPSQNSVQFLPMLMDFVASNKPSLVVVNGYSANGTFAPVEELSKTNSAIQGVLAYGGRAIITTMPGRQVVELGQYYSSGATTASTALTLNGVMAFSSGAAYAISGSGIPAGTTANVTQYQKTITLSQAATVPDGTLVSFGEPVVSGAVNNSTSITFAHPLPYSSGTYTITGTGITDGATVATTGGSAAGTLSPAQTIADGTIVTIGQTFSQTLLQPAQGLILSQGTGAVSVFDGYGCLEDATKPAYYQPAMSADGTHPTDYGHSILAFGGGNNGCVGFYRLLQQTVGN